MLKYEVKFLCRERPKEDISIKDGSFESESLQNSFDGRTSLDSNAVSPFLKNESDMRFYFIIFIIFRLASTSTKRSKHTLLGKNHPLFTIIHQEILIVH